MRITHPVRGLFSKVRLRAGTVVLAAAAVLVPGVCSQSFGLSDEESCLRTRF